MGRNVSFKLEAATKVFLALAFLTSLVLPRNLFGVVRLCKVHYFLSPRIPLQTEVSEWTRARGKSIVPGALTIQ